MSAFVTSVPEDYEYQGPTTETRQARNQYDSDIARTRALETKLRHAQERCATALRDVEALEIRMGITRRWTSTDKEFIQTAVYINERSYRRALDNIHRLIVQRLFELHSMNVAQTGESVILVDRGEILIYHLSLQHTRCAPTSRTAFNGV